MKGFGQDFSPVSASVRDSRNWNSRSNSFVRAPSSGKTPLTLPYPFRFWPGSGTWAERDKREVRKILYFRRYTPELFLDLGIYQGIHEELERKKRKYGGKHLFPSWHNPNRRLISSPPHFFMVTPGSVRPIVYIVRLTAVLLLFDIGFQG